MNAAWYAKWTPLEVEKLLNEARRETENEQSTLIWLNISYDRDAKYSIPIDWAQRCISVQSKPIWYKI